jgi:hypothetical protein
MREIRTSGLMSGEGRRVVQTIPRLSSTLLVILAYGHAAGHRFRRALGIRGPYYTGTGNGFWGWSGAAKLESRRMW